MLFGVYAAFWRANGGGPVIFAAHHHAFYKGLAAHVSFYGAVFGKRAAQVAFFLFGHGLGSFYVFAQLRAWVSQVLQVSQILQVTRRFVISVSFYVVVWVFAAHFAFGARAAHTASARIHKNIGCCGARQL